MLFDTFQFCVNYISNVIFVAFVNKRLIIIIFRTRGHTFVSSESWLSPSTGKSE